MNDVAFMIFIQSLKLPWAFNTTQLEDFYIQDMWKETHKQMPDSKSDLEL